MSNSVDEFLVFYTPAVRDLAHQLRRLIRGVMPTAVEQVDFPANMIGYSFDRSYTGLICAILPSKTNVSLLLARGVTLPDPEHLLEGAGKALARRVTMATSTDIDNPAVQMLLTSAAHERS